MYAPRSSQSHPWLIDRIQYGFTFMYCTLSVTFLVLLETYNKLTVSALSTSRSMLRLRPGPAAVSVTHASKFRVHI